MLIRSRTLRLAAATASAALLLSACSGGTTEADGGADNGADDTAAGTDEMAEDAEMADDASHDDAGDEADAAPDSAAPAVLGITATAPDGSTFTIGDFAGEPVLVETFATWCSTCRRQLGDTQQAAVEAGDDARFLVLSVETTIDPAQLEAYAQQHGFTDVQFGVLDEEGLAVLADHFGNSVLNPPSTPKFRVSTDGELSGLTTGLESAEEILATLDA